MFVYDAWVALSPNQSQSNVLMYNCKTRNYNWLKQHFLPEKAIFTLAIATPTIYVLKDLEMFSNEGIESGKKN